MEKRTNAGQVILDRRRLLGFDQGTGVDGTISNATLSPKIGPKEARGFNECGTPPVAAAKVGQKEFVRFGATLPISVTAKIGNKDQTRA